MEYSSTQVAEILEIEKSLLRSWERHTNIVRPQRNENNSRIYSEADLDILKKMKNLTVERKFKIQEAEKQILDEKKIEEAKAELLELLQIIRKTKSITE